MHRFAHPNLGRLIQPRSYGNIRTTAAEDFVWAADNDCFQGLKEDAYLNMLRVIEDLPGCRFVTVPDVVGDHQTTRMLWDAWAPLVSSIQPAAFVLQDGVSTREVPWGELAAVFIGGSTEFKLGPEAARLAREAKERGKWVHMGRVNSEKRFKYALSIGCDSVDGSSWARWKNTHLWRGLEAIRRMEAQLEIVDG